MDKEKIKHKLRAILPKYNIHSTGILPITEKGIDKLVSFILEEKQSVYKEIIVLRSGYVYDEYSTLYQKSDEIRSEYFDKEGEFLKEKLSMIKQKEPKNK